MPNPFQQPSVSNTPGQMVNVPWCHDCNQPLGLCTCVVSVAEASDPLEDFRDYHHGVVAALNEALKKAEARALAAEAQRDKAIEALKPFADAAELVEGSPDTSCAGSWITSREHIHLVPRASDLRRARSTLDEIAP